MPVRSVSPGLGLLCLCVVALCLPLAAACGDDDDAAGPDGGGQSQLIVLDPPGDSIGLPFHGQITLRVQYLGPDARPVSQVPITFSLLASATEATGGSTISTNQVVSDAAGIAEVSLAAGAERVNFRVQAQAAGAPSALFYIAVSEDGFSDLVLEPTHMGFRELTELGRIEIRRYRDIELACSELDIDNLPESVLPPRSLDSWDEVAEYRNVPAREAITLVGWAARQVDGRPLSVGCVELSADQVRPTSRLRMLMPLFDRSPALPAQLPIESDFDATPLAMQAADNGDPWAVLACPLGRAQLLLDCALDASAPDGDLDCVVGGSSSLVSAAEAQRGAANANGCRPALTDGGTDSLETIVEGQLAGPWPDDAGHAALLDGRAGPLGGFHLSSRLDTTSSGARYHRIGSMSTSSATDTYTISLIDSDRPVVRQAAPSWIDPQTGLLVIGSHSFTLDYGRFARDAFITLALEPAGLDDRLSDLGTALYQSVAVGAETSCPAFSALVCAELGQADTCLEASCESARVALDPLMNQWWQSLDVDGIDFALSGTAQVSDSDGDLVADTIGSGMTGSWTAVLSATVGEPVDLSGDFTGQAPEE